MMKPTRKAQPYRRGTRKPGAVLFAQLRGRTAFGVNPQDTARQLQRGALKRRRRPSSR